MPSCIFIASVQFHATCVQRKKGGSMNERLEAIRSEKHRQGLSDTQLADMCDLSHSTVSRAFSGKTEPSEYTLSAMETALGTKREHSESDYPDESMDGLTMRQYHALMESRIDRMRAFYNMLLTEKGREITEKRRWIIFLVILTLILVSFIILTSTIDAINPETGWIRGQK